MASSGYDSAAAARPSAAAADVIPAVSEDLAACVVLDGPLDPDSRHRYVIGLDLGLKDDRTVLTVCHAERDAAAPLALPRIVLDRLHVLSGTQTNPVKLADVEAIAYEAATAYRAPIRLDPWQAIGLAQQLRDRGVTVQEWNFSDVSVGRLAMILHLLLREHRLALPDDPDLLDELAAVRLREKRPGVYRLDHDAGQHDDRAVALGLAALALTEKPDPGRGSVSVPSGRVGPCAMIVADRKRPTGVVARALARAQSERMPRGMHGGAVVGVPGDHYSGRA
ncbi:MAG: hypothetical protein ACR2FE_05650 [Aeromicrobium sp.]